MQLCGGGAVGKRQWWGRGEAGGGGGLVWAIRSFPLHVWEEDRTGDKLS
jgi:hypothetical protein